MRSFARAPLFKDDDVHLPFAPEDVDAYVILIMKRGKQVDNTITDAQALYRNFV
jgi:hypothetical protein